MVKERSENAGGGGPDIARFIEHARDREMSHDIIRRLLLSAGWKEKEICNQLASTALGMPIPLPADKRGAHPKGGAREAFFYLTSFTCLYVSAVALIIMVFNLIDVAIPDPSQEYWEGTWVYSTIRSALSTLVVFFPLYLVFHWLIQRDTSHGKVVVGGGVERWLTYLTLFVIVVTILIDAASLLFWMLEGEATSRLFMKAIVLLAVMCGAFAYLWIGSMRWAETPKVP